jgi:Acyclic terpene utilisation family protein AtuA
MARDTHRTGCGAGFADDRIPPRMEIVERGELDYLAMQCLAECTIARETLDRSTDPGKGYTPVLLERMEAIMPPALQHGIKIVTNGGGQSHGCCAHPAQTHIRLGLSEICVRCRAGRRSHRHHARASRIAIDEGWRTI